MPTYEYGCTACGNEFELEQRISEPPIKKCPKCGKNKAARQISAGNFILKGGGWYADGYGSKSSAPKKVDTGSTTKSDTKSDAKSETKTESKPEPKAEKSEKPRAAAAAAE